MTLTSNAQYSFIKGLICEHAVNKILDELRWALDHKESAVSVFLNLQKAFEKLTTGFL